MQLVDNPVVSIRRGGRQSDATCSSNLDAAGHLVGYINVPALNYEFGWWNGLICVATLGSRDRGPRVGEFQQPVLGGRHGDEHEGQFAAQQLLCEVEEDEVTG